MADLFGDDDVPEQPETNDAKKELFRLGVAAAKKAGRKQESVRRQIAGLLKHHTPEAILSALKRSMDADDPMTYMRRLLNGKRVRSQDGLKAFLRRN